MVSSEVVEVLGKLKDSSNINSNSNISSLVTDGPLVVSMRISLTRTLDRISDLTTRVDRAAVAISLIKYRTGSNRCLLKKSRKCTSQLTKKQLKSYQY